MQGAQPVQRLPAGAEVLGEAWLRPPGAKGLAQGAGQGLAWVTIGRKLQLNIEDLAKADTKGKTTD